MKTVCYLDLIGARGLDSDASGKQTVQITKSERVYSCLVITTEKDVMIELRESDLKEALKVMEALGHEDEEA